MDRYEVELEPAEPDGFSAVVPALPGLLVLGNSVDDVLEHARAAILFHVGQPGRETVRQIEVVPHGGFRQYAT